MKTFEEWEKIRKERAMINNWIYDSYKKCHEEVIESKGCACDQCLRACECEMGLCTCNDENPPKRFLNELNYIKGHFCILSEDNKMRYVRTYFLFNDTFTHHLCHIDKDGLYHTMKLTDEMAKLIAKGLKKEYQ